MPCHNANRWLLFSIRFVFVFVFMLAHIQYKCKTNMTTSSAVLYRFGITIKLKIIHATQMSRIYVFRRLIINIIWKSIRIAFGIFIIWKSRTKRKNSSSFYNSISLVIFHVNILCYLCYMLFFSCSRTASNYTQLFSY